MQKQTVKGLCENYQNLNYRKGSQGEHVQVDQHLDFAFTVHGKITNKYPSLEFQDNNDGE